MAPRSGLKAYCKRGDKRLGLQTIGCRVRVGPHGTPLDPLASPWDPTGSRVAQKQGILMLFYAYGSAHGSRNGPRGPTWAQTPAILAGSARAHTEPH